MPLNAVWIVITIPRKEFEKESRELKKKNVNKLQSYVNYDSNVVADAKCFEIVVEECMKELQVSDVVWVPSKNGKFYQIYFTADMYDNDATLLYLQSKGIGVDKHTSVGYIPFGLFYCNEDDIDEDDFNNNFGEHKHGDKIKSVTGFKRIQNDFLNSVTSRLTVVQVVEGVRSAATVNCDFVLYTFFAGCITAAGLMNNAPVDIASAMMIEPVMSTVLAMSFGAVIHDGRLFRLGLRNCIISLIICCLIGFVYCGIAMIWTEAWNPPGVNGMANGIWPTSEMQTRGIYRTLWYGALQALAAGGAVAVSLLNNNQAALVGVAVCSTFLPPFVNGGALFVYAVHLQTRGLHENWITINDTNTGIEYVMKPSWTPIHGYGYVYYFDMRYESLCLGAVSLLYTLVNVVCLGLAAYLILKLKEIVPFGKMEANRKFFKEDIKIARDYNQRSNAPMNEEELGNQILGEWAEIAGLDPKRLMSENPEAAVTRIQTLKDIVGDVEYNDNYRTVTRRAVGRPYQGSLLRRLTHANLLKKSEVNPGFIYDDDDLDVEKYGGQRKYSAYPVARRRGSKWLVDEGSQYSTVNSGNGSLAELSVRGLRPKELIQTEKRRSSELLQRQLREAEHSPYSMWPSNARTPAHRFLVEDLRHRLNQTPQHNGDTSTNISMANNINNENTNKNNDENTKF